jgi:precorrin-3B methylase
MPQDIDGDVDLAAIAALIAVVAFLGSALRHGQLALSMSDKFNYLNLRRNLITT